MTGYGTEERRVPPHEIPTVPARPLTDLYRFTKSTMTAIFDVFALNGQIVYAIAAGLPGAKLVQSNVGEGSVAMRSHDVRSIFDSVASAAFLRAGGPVSFWSVSVVIDD
jgi:hypothetical protein